MTTYAVTIINGTVKKVEAARFEILPETSVVVFYDGDGNTTNVVSSGLWVFVDPYDPEVHDEKPEEPEKDEVASRVIELFKN